MGKKSKSPIKNVSLNFDLPFYILIFYLCIIYYNNAVIFFTKEPYFQFIQTTIT